MLFYMIVKLGFSCRGRIYSGGVWECVAGEDIRA